MSEQDTPTLRALVEQLQAHAKEHGWQDVDEPIAALLAWRPALAAAEAPAADHGQCHDLVCNADRRHPRGARGVGCSCRGRDAAYVERNQVRASLVAEVRREVGGLTVMPWVEFFGWVPVKLGTGRYVLIEDVLALPALATKETDL